MNILFLMKIYEIGGLEIATAILAKSFLGHGHKVVIASFKEPTKLMKDRTDPNVIFYTIGDFEFSTKNVAFLKKILVEENIDIVINQWGLPYVPMKVIKEAKKGLHIKVISAYHNQPDQNSRLQGVDIEINSTRNYFKKILLQLKKQIFKVVTSSSMKYVYKHSDYFVLFSKSHKEIFSKFTNIQKPEKLKAIPYPLTIRNIDETANNKLNIDLEIKKSKEIIYVGRIDYNQKRVNRIIDTWALLEKEFPEWSLIIIGDGDYRQNIESQVKDLNLKSVKFEGFQQPDEYYKRASILMLTSEYEGFGLVLTECMSFGVVPVVYGSYSAVYDIIENYKNGIILPFKKEGFSSIDMADSLKSIMDSENLLISMSSKAKEKSLGYTIEPIYLMWEELFLF